MQSSHFGSRSIGAIGGSTSRAELRLWLFVKSLPECSTAKSVIVMTFENIIGSDTAYQPLLYVSLFFTTFLHEGTAIATGALFVVQEHASPILTTLFLVAGIVTGDLSIYGLGALARRSDWLQRRLGFAANRDTPAWLSSHLLPTVATCRVVPGMLWPAFLSYGWCGVPLRRFAATTIIVTGLYVPLVLTLFVQFGKYLVPYVPHAPWLVFGIVVTAATAFAARYAWQRLRGATGDGLLPPACPLPAA
jgi:membrane protein DedA with SNARE-associated domain